jgi:hypothetical protein
MAEAQKSEFGIEPSTATSSLGLLNLAHRGTEPRAVGRVIKSALPDTGQPY